MKDHFLIVQVSSNINTANGDYVYRIHQPAVAMGKIPGIMVVNLPIISPHLKEFCLCADVLVLHLTWEPDLLPIVSERIEIGLPTVFEISDNFMALPQNITHELSFSNPLSLATTFQLIQLSDAIQGVSQILLERFSFLHDKRVVFENQIMSLGSCPKAIGKEISIGWGGSMGHTEDLKWIAPTIKELCDNHDQVNFHFMGNNKQFVEVFGPDENDRYSYTKPGSLTEYLNFLETLDIGIAPLMASPFNICRSDVKFIEYASRGVVPVLSDIDPYKNHAKNGINSFLFDSPESLKNILEMLINDVSFLQTVKNNAYKQIKNERMEDNHAVRRISFYKKLSKARSSKMVPMDLLTRYSDQTELYYPKQTEAEKQLIKGLDHKEKGRLGNAIEMWLNAALEEKGYYFPFLLLAENSENEEEILEKLRISLTINPESLRGRLQLGQALKLRNPEGARREFEKALQVFPDFGPAWKELALLEKEDGNMEKAATFLNRALEGDPFFASAASELGKVYLIQEKTELALEAFRVAVNLIPENLDYEIDLIKALIQSGDLAEAIQECKDWLRYHPQSKEIYDILLKTFNSKQEEGHSLK